MTASVSSSSPLRRIGRWRSAAATGLAVSLVLAACGSSGTTKSSSAASSTTQGSSGQAATVKPTGTLQVGLSAAMNTLSPMPFGAKNFYLFNLLYSTPITLSGSTPTPAVVENWSTAANNLSMTLHLRPGLSFSDGTPLDASAIVWNIGWQKLPATASHARTLWNDVTATALNQTTVGLAFTHPMPEIFAMLAGMPIVKPNAPTSGVSSGPYMVSKFVPGTSLSVTANTHYWHTGADHLESLVFTNYSEPATAALALRSDTIGLLLLPAATQLAGLKSAGEKFLAGPASNDGYTPSLLLSLLVNTSSAPLNNVKVRQALSLAFDRSQFVATAMAGQGIPAESVLSSTSSAYLPSPSTASFDIAKAKALLAQAGVSHLTLSVDAVSILPQATFMPVYQQDLAKIGVTLNINTIDVATWATIIGPGNFPQLITQENGFVDNDPALNFGNLDLTSTNNSEHFSSPQYTAMIQAAAQETDPAKRQADYKAIGAYLQQQMFIIPLATASSAAAAYSPKVSGVESAPFSGVDYTALTLG